MAPVLDPAARAAIARRREAYEANPAGFIQTFAAQEEELRRRLTAARMRLAEVAVPEEADERATALAAEAFCAGQRAEIVLVQAARALAAWEGRCQATPEDVERVAELVLYHRRREAPPHPPEQPEQEEKEEPPEPGQSEEPEQPEARQEQEKDEAPPPAGKGKDQEDAGEEREEKDVPALLPPTAAEETVFAVGEPFSVRRIDHGRDRILRKGSGRRSRTLTPTRAGRYTQATAWRGRGDLAFDATLRAAAPHQQRREKNGLAIAVAPGDIREKVREKRIGNLLLFVVDASGSMGAQQRMVAAKGAVLSLLLDAYQKRDRVELIAFKGEQAAVLLPPTNSVELAYRCLEELPTGGRTPLAAGLLRAYETARVELLKNPNLAPLLIIVSDGRGNVGLGNGKPLEEAWRVAALIREEQRIKSLVVDVEKEGFLSFGLARRLAEALGATCFRVEDLKAETLVWAVRAFTEQGC